MSLVLKKIETFKVPIQSSKGLSGVILLDTKRYSEWQKQFEISLKLEERGFKSLLNLMLLLTKAG